MAYTTPRTWVAGEVPTATNLNTHLRDNMLGTSAGVTNGTNVNAASVGAYQRCGTVFVLVNTTNTGATAGGATIFTLAAGFRPPTTWFGQVVNTTTGAVVRLDITTAGVVSASAAIANGETLRGSFSMPI